MVMGVHGGDATRGSLGGEACRANNPMRVANEMIQDAEEQKTDHRIKILSQRKKENSKTSQDHDF
jgi:hypothetical protein